ncbi:MAG: PilZ domain-containing protein [Myxococcota bacterium]
MNKLKCMVIGEPSEAIAQRIVEHTERLAEQRLVATHGQELLDLIERENPELVVLSLELCHPKAEIVAKELHAHNPTQLVVITFRELSIPTMERLGSLGVDEFLPQPIDITQLFRVTSDHFKMPFRRHVRFPVVLDLVRRDGVMLGRTRNLSEGGLLMDCVEPVQTGSSFLIEIRLPEDPPVRVRCIILGVKGETPPHLVARVQFDNFRGDEQRRLVDYLGQLEDWNSLHGVNVPVDDPFL